MNSFVIGNPNKCIGCRTCLIACVVAHSKENIFLSKEKDIEFNPRISVIKTASVTGPIQCRQCEDSPCLNVCPVRAIKYKDGVMRIDKDICIGCKTCIIACPFGAIEMVVEGNKVIANKCDLCASRENGPACVEVCLTGALMLINEDKFKESVSKKRILNLQSLNSISKGSEI